MTNNDSVLKGIFIRALTEARMRNPGTALAQYIEAFITVQASGSPLNTSILPSYSPCNQFNSLLAHARAPDTDFYTTAWSSGPANTFVLSSVTYIASN